MKKRYSKLFMHVALILFLIITFSPLLIVVSTSLKSPGDLSSPLQLFTDMNFDSYLAAFERMDYPNSFINSFVSTSGSVLAIVVIASMAAYPLGRIENKLSRFFYVLFISGLVIPSQMVVIPIAEVFYTLGIPSGRFTPMIMFITCSIPFSVFLYTGFVQSVPPEIEESAYIDGANLFQRFTKVVFPLLAPATTSVVITQGIWIWNDYFFPLMFVNQQSEMSLPVTMLRFLGDRENPAQWSILFAACVLAVIPLLIVFSFLQEKFIGGATAGSVKG